MKPPTIRVELYKGKKLSHGHPICITVTSKGKVARKTVSSALPSEWSKNKINKSRKDHVTENDHIDSEYTKYKLIFNELKKKDFNPGDVFKVQKIDSPLFSVNALEYMKYLKSLSMDSYNAADSRYKKIIRYAGDFRLDEVSSRWIAGFWTHCLTKEKNNKGKTGNSPNTINFAIKFIGQVANFSGVKVDLPKITFTKTIKQKLTSEELIRFSGVPSLPGTHEFHARNTFMLQFYLRGMRIKDALKLEWSMIKGDRLFYGTSKTDQEHSIKIVPQLQEILNLYPKGKYILPWIRSEVDLFQEIKNRTSVINWHLKKIAQKAGINKNVSTHIARHTFASISDKKLDGDLKQIQGMLGHSRRSQTEDYIEDLRKADELDDAADKVFG